MGIGGKNFPLEQQSKDDEQIVYHGTYDTEGVPHTKSGDRQPVQVSIEVKITEKDLCLLFLKIRILIFWKKNNADWQMLKQALHVPSILHFTTWPLLFALWT